MKRALALAFSLCLSAATCVAPAGAQERVDVSARAVTMHGVVERVDYAAGTIDLRDAHGRLRTVFTSPSTTIIGARESGYQELSDVRPGVRVTIEASRSDQRLDASLIKLRHDR